MSVPSSQLFFPGPRFRVASSCNYQSAWNSGPETGDRKLRTAIEQSATSRQCPVTMRPRDLTRFDGTRYDLLVVGGGIHGLACAYEAASRGLRVALVEAADFGSGATFNHQKTAHGGLRSLATGHLGRARESIRERRALARIAPWFLRPLPFMIGTYRSVVKNRVALRAAFKFDAWLGRRRNDAVEPELHLPPAQLTSRAATLKLFPGVRQDGLTGGANWYDYQIVYTNRLGNRVPQGGGRARRR